MVMFDADADNWRIVVPFVTASTAGSKYDSERMIPAAFDGVLAGMRRAHRDEHIRYEATPIQR